MKAKDLRDLTDSELKEKHEDYLQDYFSQRLKKATDEFENIRLFRELRKDIARIKTIMRERELKIKREKKL